LLSALAFAPAAAQIRIDARLDTSALRIGEQCRMHVEVDAPTGVNVDFPDYAAEGDLARGVEVLDAEADSNACEYNLTCFDEGDYQLNPYVLVGGDTMRASALTLRVNTVPVDTLHYEEFNEAGDVVNVPFRLSKWLVGALILFVLLLLAAYLLNMKIKKLPPARKQVEVPPTVPKTSKAMEAMENIRAIPRDSREERKQYYMRLTDVLRDFISERFGVNAGELTSSEIVQRLTQRRHTVALGELQEVLQAADLVKFAKYESSLTEADQSLLQAMNYLQSNRVQEAPAAPPVPHVVWVEDKAVVARRRRLSIGFAAACIAAAVVGLELLYELITIFI